MNNIFIMCLIWTHALLAFTTLFSGAFVYFSKKPNIWSANSIWFYLLAHLGTAFTGFFFGRWNEFSPFKALAVLTIFAFIRTTYFIKLQNYNRARRVMIGAYFGLCIAFIGTLHPERILGFRFFVETLHIDFDLAQNIWMGAMVLAIVSVIVKGLIDTKKANIEDKLIIV